MEGSPVFHPHVTGFPPRPDQGLKRQFEEHGYKVVINVSDDPMWANAHWYRENGVEYHWIPMGDCTPLGLQSIYGAVMVMLEAERRNLPLLLHCAAGINRSQTVMDCYHYVSKGEHRVWTWMNLTEVKVNWMGGEPVDVKWMNMLERNCAKPGTGLPKLAEMEIWMDSLRSQLASAEGIQAGSFDLAYLAAEERN